jgi:hypothetical protein
MMLPPLIRRNEKLRNNPYHDPGMQATVLSADHNSRPFLVENTRGLHEFERAELHGWQADVMLCLFVVPPNDRGRR